jgi:hypothetical protein
MIETTRKKEEFLRYAIIALALLGVDVLLRLTVLRSVP